MRQASEVFAGSVKPELPYVYIAVTSFSAELLTLTIGLYGGIKPIWKNAFGLVIRSRCFGKIRNRPRLQINSHYRSRVIGFIAGEDHLLIVVVKILRFKGTAPDRSRSATISLELPAPSSRSCTGTTEKAIFNDFFEIAAPSLIF